MKTEGFLSHGRGESLLETIFNEEEVEDSQDVEMLDVEKGELVEQVPKTGVGESSNNSGNQENLESNRLNLRYKGNKKKNKRRRGSNAGPTVTNVNRFVLDAFKHLRERKSYLMYTAVGCIGVAALSDLIKEITEGGGQKTANGSHFRNGGGILWNIIKARDSNAYEEIMRKGTEFEKQFKQQFHANQEPKQRAKPSSESISIDDNQVNGNSSEALELKPRDQKQHGRSTAKEKRPSVHDRIRAPVTYDDLPGGEDPKGK